MNRRNGIIAGVVVVAVLILLMGSLFTVHQTRQALILQLGNPVRVIDTPGLHAKIPFIQAVEFYEKRVLDFDAPSVELVLGDQKRLVVDAFARYRISSPLRFRQSAGSSSPSAAGSSRSCSRACAASWAACRCSRCSRATASSSWAASATRPTGR